jgi:glycosyltransferase involved in cell wall biosynthesis
MKILHIISGLKNGGAETVLYRLVKDDTSDNNHEVISLINKGFYGEYLEKAGVTVHVLGFGEGRFTIKPLVKLYKIIHLYKPDVIQTWMYHANFIGALVYIFTKYKNIFWSIHHSDLDSKKTPAITLAINKICALLSTKIPKSVIFCSKFAANVHVNVGYDKNKITIINNGVNVNEFVPNLYARKLLRSEWGVKDNCVLLGMVARWDIHKDHKTLLTALSHMNLKNSLPWKCILAGQRMNDSNIELVNLLNEYNLIDNMILLDVRSDIPAIMSSIDLHVLSSSGEAFGNTTVEAMSCGTPAVVTNVGAGEYIVGETGWVVPSSKPILLAESIMLAMKLKGDDYAWGKRKISSRQRIINKFSIDKMNNKYNKIWNKQTL